MLEGPNTPKTITMEQFINLLRNRHTVGLTKVEFSEDSPSEQAILISQEEEASEHIGLKYVVISNHYDDTSQRILLIEFF